MTEEVSKKWIKLSSLKEEKFIVLINETINIDEIINFFMSSCWHQIGAFVKLMRKVSMRWKKWSDFKTQHSIQFSRKRLIEDRDTILEVTSKRQELLNETNCMNDSKDFQDAESVRSGQSHVISQSTFFKLVRDPLRNVQTFSGNSELLRWPPSIWDMIYRETFLQVQFSLLQLLIRKSRTHKSLMYQNTHHRMWWVKVKYQFVIRDVRQDRPPEIQSSLVREDFQRIMGQFNDCKFQILILTNSPRQQHSLVGRKDSRLRYVLVHNVLRKLCYGSKK